MEDSLKTITFALVNRNLILLGGQTQVVADSAELGNHFYFGDYFRLHSEAYSKQAIMVTQTKSIAITKNSLANSLQKHSFCSGFASEFLVIAKLFSQGMYIHQEESTVISS